MTKSKRKFRLNKNFKRLRIDSGSSVYFPDAADGSPYVPPGYNLLGPGNDWGLPTNAGDELAYKHDAHYGDIEKAGYNPKFWASKADDDFIEAKVDDFYTNVGQKIFAAKRAIAPYIPDNAYGFETRDDWEKRLKRARIAEMGFNPFISELEAEHAHHHRKKLHHYFQRMVSGASRAQLPWDEDMTDGDSSGAQSGSRDSSQSGSDVFDQSVTNLANVGSGSGAGSGTSGAGALSGMSAAAPKHSAFGETDVSPYRNVFRNPFQQTVTVSMPYQQIGTFAITLNTPTVYAMTWRLNSIYDVQSNNFSFTDVGSGAPVADTADATIQTPMYRSYWSQFYKYWTVIKSRYSLKVWMEDSPTSSQGAERQGMTVFHYEHGRQGPPLYTSTAPNVLVPGHFRSQHPGMKGAQTLTAKSSTAVFIGWDDKLEFNGAYRPGSVIHDVVEDELAQRWHRRTEPPPTEEMVTFIIQKPDVMNGLSVDVRYCFDIEYIVQWKDVEWALEYVTPNSTVGGVIGYAAQVNTPSAPTTA